MTELDIPWLSLVIWLPIIGGFWVVLTGKTKDPNAPRWVALAVSIVTFVLSIPLYTQFDSSTHEMQFVENLPWIEALDINYHLGMDGISMPLILLTTFSTVLVIIAVMKSTSRSRSSGRPTTAIA